MTAHSREKKVLLFYICCIKGRRGRKQDCSGFTVHNIVNFKPQEEEYATLFENLINLSLQNAFNKQEMNLIILTLCSSWSCIHRR